MNSPTTWTLPNYCRSISKTYLQPGDMLDWPYHHCVLFRKWANSDRTRLVIYELANSSQDMNLRETSLSEFSSYGAYRYDNIR
ncbi:MAG: hypothetical protein ACRDT4_15565 [Micromonosporaceae bacterium]